MGKWTRPQWHTSYEKRPVSPREDGPLALIERVGRARYFVAVGSST